MRVKRLGACRGDGRAFLKVAVVGGEGVSNPIHEIVAKGEVLGNSVPVDIYPFVGTSLVEQLWVVVLPVLDAPSIRIELSDSRAGESCSFMVAYEALKWESRLNYRLRKDLCAQIRDYERSFTADRFQLRTTRYLETGVETVWRVCVEWSLSGGGEPSMPTISFLDARGVDARYEYNVFEFQKDTLSRDGRRMHRLILSVKTPADAANFVIVANDESGHVRRGFCSMDGRTREGMKYESWKYMKDARADDGAYRSWFSAHRAQPGELEGQRASWRSFPRKPIFSIVVPCYESDPAFLSATVGSVVAQSYGNWELLLVDASADQGTARMVAADAHNDRIRYIPLEGNKGIVGNTNEGIRHATGDVVAFLDHDDLLEPDALYHYARALNEHPEAKVLFCDEDTFERDGEYGQPAFKTKLNVDLLYSHNCVTHFLAIDAAFLLEIGLSSEDVAGAQDYDLTLRALAAGGGFVHVPRVLYHWRIHEGSTSGDNLESKPYAQTAGRLALQRHFDSLGIAGKVEETAHPFVYRMRYELPEPRPLVSIVIPSKDQADMLHACVSSIVEKSTYDNFEIIVVENNSEDPETPANYDKIAREGGSRVHVVHWDGEFNYSRIINYGVQKSSGEYVLLLNNDTEVITPGFIEEMLGYLQRPDVGVVGAKLYFRDELTQHAGVLVGPHDAVAHVNQDFPRDREGYLGRAVRPGNYSAVTGACQMVKRDVFERVGGYDERFAVGFNDVDFCLRVWREGLRVVFTPYAELFHYEFVSRGREVADASKLARWKREQALFIQTWSELFLEGDPFTNPNLDRDSAYYALSSN